MTSSAVKRLRLHRFRNHAETVIDLGPGLNVFAGRNAEGKTNLLEALATLTLTRSPRAASSADLIQWGAEECRVEARIGRDGTPTDLALTLRRDPASHRIGRTVAVDNKPRPARAILGICPVVLFWPDDLQLVKAGPEGRRRLLDVVLSQTDARIATELVRYRRVLEQRNALLRHGRDGGSAAGLASFESEFIDAAAIVRHARAALLDDLAPRARAALAELGGDGEELDLSPIVAGENLGKTPVESVDNYRAGISSELDRRRSDELLRGISLVGPHRDDVEISVSGRAARTTASQGQQRSIVLALKLAEVRYVRDVLGRAPVLILDDVLSELDEQRRAGLFDAISDANVQTLVTTAEPGAVEIAGASTLRLFHVHSGTVVASA